MGRMFLEEGAGRVLWGKLVEWMKGKWWTWLLRKGWGWRRRGGCEAWVGGGGGRRDGRMVPFSVSQEVAELGVVISNCG